MGFYFRKSKNFGPFRVTASKSGLSFSVGVKGFRISSGPRGRYISMGANGLYYRKRIDGTGGSTSSKRAAGQPRATQGPPMQTIDFNRLDDLAASSPREIVEGLRRFALPPEASRATNLTLLLALLCLLGGVVSGSWAGFGVGLLLALVFFFWTGYLHNKTVKKHGLQLNYDLDPAMRQAWLDLTGALEAIGRQGQLWRMAAFGERQRAPSEELQWGQMRREALRISRRNPPGIESSLTLLAIEKPSHTLYLLPDLLLVYDEPKPKDWRVSAIQYAELQIGYEEFTDALDSPPADTPVVGYTWQHVTKSGSPDLRYRHNPRLTLCRLGLLSLESKRGLHEWLVISDPAKGQALYAALCQMQTLTEAFAPAHEDLSLN